MGAMGIRSAPLAEHRLDPFRDRHRPDGPSLAQKVRNDLLPLAQQHRIDIYPEQFAAPESASDEHRVIPLALKRLSVHTHKQSFASLGSKPVPDPNSDPGTPLTRRIPAASSGLSRPESAASYATRRTPSIGRLIVAGACCLCSR